MRVTLHAARRFAPLTLLPKHRLTISDEHPDYFEVSYRVPANYGLVLGALLGGELVDEAPERPAAEAVELVRLVAGLPRPIPRRPPLRLLE